MSKQPVVFHYYFGEGGDDYADLDLHERTLAQMLEAEHKYRNAPAEKRLGAIILTYLHDAIPETIRIEKEEY